MAGEEVERRLAAIVAADVAGFSRLVSLDEEAILNELRAHRRELIDPKIAEYRGRIANTAGDSLLIEFPSVVEALRCAIDMQQGMASRNSGKPVDRRIEFRIGINLGDVIAQEADLLGDGVNIAARLEGLADPGGICVSRAARDQVRDRMAISFEDKGEIEVKNIPRPVRVFRVATPSAAMSPAERTGLRSRSWSLNRQKFVLAAVLSVVLAIGAISWHEPWKPHMKAASMEAMRLPLPDKPSVAVLPFEVSSSGDGDVEFANAVNEDLTRGLARVSGLFVIARGSTLKYKGEDAIPARVSEELGVRFVVRASMRRSKDRVRIDAELVDALSGRIIWSDRLERASDDVFALQDALVHALVSRTAQGLSKAGNYRRFTSDVEAYFSWFEGDREALLNVPASYGKARALALAALERDPKFVRASALLAFVDTQTGYFKLVDDFEAVLVRARNAAAAAVAAQPDDWYTQSVHAQTLLNLRDYEGANLAFARAIELDPANSDLLTRSTLPLIFLGKGRAAEARLRIAIRLNPYHDWLPHQLLGQALFLLERYEEASDRLLAAQRENPSFIGNMWWRAATYGQLGNAGEARRAAGEILSRMPQTSISQSFIQIRDTAAMERFRQGLRRAGLPE